MNYTEVKPEYVITTLAGGVIVKACDLSLDIVINCEELTVKEINTLVSKPNVKFYKGVEDGQA